MAENPSLESTLKSHDTEEFIDIHFYRPIGYKWAIFFKNKGVTPNTVTIASIFLGTGAGVCFYFQPLWITVVGILLLIWANSFDSADGQLARMTNSSSDWGRILDGFSGDLWFASIYIAISLRLYPTWSSLIWVMAIIAGYFHSKQASMADYYRNVHLLFLKGEAGSELTRVSDLRKKYKALTWKHDFAKKMVEYLYMSYTKGQENWSPNAQNLLTILDANRSKLNLNPFRENFRTKSLPLMKWTNILSFNTRAIVLMISLLISQPWIYFVFELTVLNVILAYMIIKHETICKHFVAEIEEGKYNINF